MTDTARKVVTLIGPGQGGRWLVVGIVAAVVSVAEAGSTVLVFALLGVLVGDGGELAVPVLGDVRSYLPWQGAELLMALGLATALGFVTRSWLVVVQQYVQFRVAWNAGARLSARLLDGYLGMPYEFHLQRNSSEMVRNAFDSVQRFVQEGLVPGARVLGKLAIVAGVFAVLFASSPLVTGLAVLALGPLTWGIVRLVHPRVKRLGRTAQTMANHNLRVLQQSLHGVRDIVVLGREQTFVDSYVRDRKCLARAQYLRQTAAQIPRAAIESGLAILIVLLVAVAAAAEGGMTEALPLLGVFGYAAARLMPELQQITIGLNSMKFVGPAVDDIYADLSAFDAKQHTGRGSVEPLPFRESLIADGVTYHYPGSEVAALRDIHVAIVPGQSIGIVGPTGGGKTTLIDVLLGLLVPTEGSVTVDGIDVHAHARAWQAVIGVVPQMVFLTDDTLRANIALGVPADEIDEDAIAEALSIAQLDGFVESLPEGLDTMVGERGVRVSGGQRQRLAIARALYRRPSVLVFDEGTSALDNETETALMSALERLRGQRTLITVAHRLTTVEGCDSVWLVRDGRIVDQGPLGNLVVRQPELQRAETLADRA